MIRTLTFLIVVLGLSVNLASAQTCGGLANLQNNTPADATQVMNNFNTLLGCINAQAAPINPQGRLTLSQTDVVMKADVTAATTIYYSPYVGQSVPIYNSTSTRFVPTAFTQLTLTTTTVNQVLGGIYDVFAFLNPTGGAITLGFGPAWSNTTTRSSGTQLQQLQGLWTNQIATVLQNGATTYNISANGATYLGTVLIQAPGQMAMQFHPAAAPGGSNNWLGVWNAYNRVSVRSAEGDSASNWTYGTNAWQAAHGSNANRITWIDGLGQSCVSATYVQFVQTTAATQPAIGVAFNTTTSSGGVIGSFYNGASATIEATIVGHDTYCRMGSNFVQAVETSYAGTPTYWGQAQHSLYVDLEM
jgi:hypothetical protein